MKFICFDQIDSTNAYLKLNYQTLDDLTLVSALNQSQGKGRNNRTWYSDGNDLLISLLLKNEKYFPYYKQISILSAYSIVKVLEDYQIKDLKIKWPNDIYYKDEKLCGILLEAVSSNKMECLIIGIGLNVNQVEFNQEYLINPTSLKKIMNKDFDLDEIKKKIYDSLVNNLNKLIDGYDFYKEIKQYDYLKDLEAYILIDKQKQKVNVIGINEDYSLRVKFNDSIKDIEAGEVSFHI